LAAQQDKLHAGSCASPIAARTTPGVIVAHAALRRDNQLENRVNQDENLAGVPISPLSPRGRP
jgi:hypothetical protein